MGFSGGGGGYFGDLGVLGFWRLCGLGLRGLEGFRVQAQGLGVGFFGVWRFRAWGCLGFWGWAFGGVVYRGLGFRGWAFRGFGDLGV